MSEAWEDGGVACVGWGGGGGRRVRSWGGKWGKGRTERSLLWLGFPSWHLPAA